MNISYLLEHNRYCNLIGIIAILGIAWLFSHNRSKISWRLVISGLLLQWGICVAVLGTSTGQTIINEIATSVSKLYHFAGKGTEFLFGNLAMVNDVWGFVFAIQVLPVLIFFGAFMSLLFHWGIIQRVVNGLSYLVRPIMGTSGAETLCAIANSFLGQTEAPLLIKHYLPSMTKSELLVVMVSGMATISGAILTVYAQMGIPAQHLLTASVMAIPASLVIAKILLPETDVQVTQYDGSKAQYDAPAVNMFDAIALGTRDGLTLALNVGAILISFIALIALANALFATIISGANTIYETFGLLVRIPSFKLEDIFAYVCAPFGFLLGFTGKAAYQAAQLIGTKVAINELIAFRSLATSAFTDRQIAILTYALCGFSNFSCIGIQIGGIGALVPAKRVWLTQLGMYAVLGGALANLLSAMIVGLVL